MFTGIIEGLGTVTSVRSAGQGKRLTIAADFDLSDTKVGDSIAINALSGGVDSSVAAALLVRQGVPVIGVTLRVWPSLRPVQADAHFDSCCSPAAVEDARGVAAALGIRTETLPIAPIMAGAENGPKLKPFALPARTFSGAASVMVSTSPPVARTTGTVP